MHEKAMQGVYLGRAQLGYRDNETKRTIEVDPVDSIRRERNAGCNS